MNPLELAKKVMAAIADYEVSTALAALDIARVLVNHRESCRLAFNADELKSGSDTTQCS